MFPRLRGCSLSHCSICVRASSSSRVITSVKTALLYFRRSAVRLCFGTEVFAIASVGELESDAEAFLDTQLALPAATPTHFRSILKLSPAACLSLPSTARRTQLRGNTGPIISMKCPS